MSELNYLSFSRISAYADCSLKYYFSYIKKLPRTSGAALEFGSSIHEALDKFHSAITLNTVPDVEMLVSAFENAWEDKVMFGDADISGDDVTKHRNMGVTLLQNYYSMNKGTEWFAKPIATEGAYKVPIIDPYTGEQLVSESVDKETGEVTEKPLEFYVILDLIHIFNGSLMITDHKTSGKKYSDHKINTDVQLTIYQYAIEYLIKEGLLVIEQDYDDIKVCFNVFHKVKAAYVKPYITTRSKEDIRRALTIAKHALTGINNEIYVPNFSSMWCGNCEYREACQAWGKYED